MEDFPSCPPLEDAPDVLDGGHLWLLEQVDGYPLLFVVEDGSWLVFGGPNGSFRDDTPPPPYRPAVRHVRERIDRSLLGEVPEGATFYGVAATFRRIGYDWDRLPAFLGVDVRTGDQLLAPDAAERTFRRLGLVPVNAFEKEVAARHFSRSSYDVPGSEWYDGRPLGVVVRNKAGGRALLSTSGSDPVPPEPPDEDPVESATRLTTPDRIEAAIGSFEAEGRAPDFDAVRERAVERVLREEWGTIAAAHRPLDPDAVIGAIEVAVRDYLVEERPRIVGDG